MKRILSILVVVLMLAGCTAQPKQVVQQPVEQSKPLVEQGDKIEDSGDKASEGSNLFDARKVNVGDEVAGLKIVKVEIPSRTEKDYDAYVSFEGEVTVKGTYKHNQDDEFLDHEISFHVDAESAGKLPKLAHDERNVWFTFMNHDEAEKAFGPPGSEGEAEIIIRNYSINYAHTEIWNTAELVKVVQK
ncbi:MAG: lipoprotein [Caulobacteraceae bacterium]